MSFNLARNHCAAQFGKKKDLYVRRTSSNTANFLTEISFWSLANNILNYFCKSNFPLIHADGCIANTLTKKANIFGSLFLTNSSSDDSTGCCPLSVSFLQPGKLFWCNLCLRKVIILTPPTITRSP